MLLEPLARHSERRIDGPFHCERAIRTTIGRELRSYNDLSESIPDRMLELLKQIDDVDVQQKLMDGVHAEVRSRSIDEFGGGARRDQAWAA
jgi:hypothetical protein